MDRFDPNIVGSGQHEERCHFHLFVPKDPEFVPIKARMLATCSCHNMVVVALLLFMFTSSLHISGAQFAPGDEALSFTINSLGNLTKPYVYSQDSGLHNGDNLIVLRVDKSDFFIMNFFNNASVDEFFTNGFGNDGLRYSTTFIFLANPDQLNVLAQVQNILYSRLSMLPFSEDVKENMKSCLFFGENIPDFFNNVFNDWPTRQRYVSIDGQSSNPISRLDGRYGWCSWPCSDSATATTCKSGTVVASETKCSVPAMNISKGMFVLVQLTGDKKDDGECNIYNLTAVAERNGAAGIIFSQVDGVDVIEVGGDHTNPSIDGVSIIVSMVAYDGGQQMLKAIFGKKSSQLVFSELTRGVQGKLLAVDAFGKLVSVGWEKFPLLMTLGWQSWWLHSNYRQNKKRESQPGVVISVFDRVPSGGSWSTPGASTNISIPSVGIDETDLMVDFSLSCQSASNFGCGIWDRVVGVYVCCDSEASSCGVELSRYITAFRRGEGNWVTNITHLKPLLKPGDTCRISIESTPELWYVTMDLRFLRPTIYKKQQTPVKTIPLWNGQITFDQNYNNRSAAKINIAKGTSKVVLSSVITGHGYDDFGCGEFCATTHHFKFFDESKKEIAHYVQNFSLPDTNPQFGCANLGYRNGIVVEQVNGGGDVAFPNEHGTWTYGRNGWCNGQKVSPWVQPLNLIAFPETIFIEYNGYFRGQTPNPKQSPGNMIVQTFLTLYN